MELSAASIDNVEEHAEVEIVIEVVEKLVKKFNDKDLRIIKDNNNKMYFVAKDICTILNYKHTFDCVNRACKNDPVYASLEDSRQRKRNIRIIDEIELHRLIFTSKSSNTEVVQKWIIEEVLPSIRVPNNFGKSALIKINKTSSSGDGVLNTVPVDFIQKELKIKSGKGENAITIQMRSDGYVNATQIAKAAGKLFADWSRLESTQRLAEELSASMEISISQLIEVHKGRTSKFAQGSWIHPDLAIQFAQWCSPNFAIQVSRWVRELALTGRVELGNEKSNAELEELQKQLIVAKMEKEQSNNQIVSMQHELNLSFVDREQQYINMLVQQCKTLDLDKFTTLVNYVVFIPGDEQHFEFKYGQTQNITKRIKDHIKTFGVVQLLAVVKSTNGLLFEHKFASFLEKKNIKTSRMIEYIVHRELFVTNENTPLSEVLAMFNSVSHAQYSPSENDMVIQSIHNELTIFKNEKKQLLKEIGTLKAKIALYENGEQDIVIETAQQHSNDDYKTILTLLKNYHTTVEKLHMQHMDEQTIVAQRKEEVLNKRITELETKDLYQREELVALLCKYDTSITNHKQQTDVLLGEILKLKKLTINTDDASLITSEELLDALPEEKKDEMLELKVAPTHSSTFVSVDKTRKVTYLKSDLDENGVEKSKQCKACGTTVLLSLFVKQCGPDKESKRANICKMCKHNAELKNKKTNAAAALEHKQLCYDCAIEKPVACFQGDRRVCLECTNRQRRDSEARAIKYIQEHPDETRVCKVCKKDVKLSEYKGKIFTTCHPCHLAVRKTNYLRRKLNSKAKQQSSPSGDDVIIEDNQQTEQQISN